MRISSCISWALVSALALLLAATPVWAAPAWVWLDDAGRQVFSDLPPPATVPNERILRQPAAPPQNRAARPDGAAPGAAAAVAPERPGVGPVSAPAQAGAGGVVFVESEEQLKAIEKKNAAIRAENCRQAQESLAQLQRPGRLAMVNEQGQRVIMNEAMRREQISRAEQIMRDNCP